MGGPVCDENCRNLSRTWRIPYVNGKIVPENQIIKEAEIIIFIVAEIDDYEENAVISRNDVIIAWNCENGWIIDEKAERKSWNGHEMAFILSFVGIFWIYFMITPYSTKEEIIAMVHDVAVNLE